MPSTAQSRACGWEFARIDPGFPEEATYPVERRLWPRMEHGVYTDGEQAISKSLAVVEPPTKGVRLPGTVRLGTSAATGML